MMRRVWVTISVLMLFFCAVKSEAVVPGTGVRIPQLSDDFEDADWGYDYGNDISSNGLWNGSFRGAPEILEPVTPPSGGLSNSTTALTFRSRELVDPVAWEEHDANNPIGQEDFVSKNYSTRFGRYLLPADYPSFTARVYMPDDTQWVPTSAYTLGFRTAVYYPGTGTTYYPSVWFLRVEQGNQDARICTRDTEGDHPVKAFASMPAQWHTVGISWDGDGTHFYWKEGSSDLTSSDNIWNDTEAFAAIKYHFISLGGYGVTNFLTCDIKVDDYSVWAAGMAEMTAPANEATGVSINPTLSWNAGYNATSHAVYLGTSSVLGAGDLQTNQTGTTFSPDTLDYETTYYWRVDETNTLGVSKGMTHSFTTFPEPLNTNTLPYAESFESYDVGEAMSGEEGWQPTTGTIGVVSTNAEALYALTNDYSGSFPIATTHTKVLELMEEDQWVTNVVASTTQTMVKTEMMIQPALWNIEDPPEDVDTDAQAGVYVDIDGKLNIMHADTADGLSFSNTWHALTGGPTITEDEWIRLAVIKDYTTKRFQVQVNGGTAISDTDGWDLTGTSQPGSWFYMVNTNRSQLSSIEFKNRGYVDDMVVESYVLPVPPGTASSPSPSDDATDVSVTADLSWTAGSGATSHDVYFGTTSPGTFQGNQGGTTFDTGTMSASTEHFWRIDEVNANGTTTGTVWSFTTAVAPPGAASSPSPSDTADDVSVTADLSWTAGSGATSHDVYFGTTTPLDSGDLQGNQSGVTFDPGTLNQDTTYYWRIDEVNAGGKTSGTEWSFTTVLLPPGAASSPSPADDATDIATTANLSWTAGSGATSHDVYFGTTSPGTYQGNQAGVTFDPGTLSASTEYFWRIDEVNGAGTTQGTVWSFTTAGSTPEISFTTSSSQGNEGSSPAAITVEISETSASSVEVGVGVTGGTATGGGDDFTLVTNVVTIPAGNLSSSAQLDVTDDYVQEDDETVQLTLSNPVNATLGSPTVHTYTILNDDGNFEAGTVTASNNWTQVVLANEYVYPPVVVCVVDYDNNTSPVVVRLRNVTNDTFEVKLQNPGDGSTPVADTVHFIAMEAGAWTLPDGTKIEAQRVTSDGTNHENDWDNTTMESYTYLNSYTTPVVLGQVMTANDADWSTFWTCQGLAKKVPSSLACYVGKHVGEDTDTTRATETLGVIVVETESNGSLGSGIAFQTFVGGDSVDAMDDNPPSSYSLTSSLFGSTPQVGIVTQNAMDETDGSWACLYGSSPLSQTTVNLSLDEDQIGDNERSLRDEQAACFIIESACIVEMTEAP